jgi:hypothetical protein
MLQEGLLQRNCPKLAAGDAAKMTGRPTIGGSVCLAVRSGCKLWGIGRAPLAKLIGLGVDTVADLRDLDPRPVR